MKDQKLLDALELFRQARDKLKKNPGDALCFAAAAKTFEVAFEYAWKAIKREADRAGLETYSPRDAVKAGAQLKLIHDVELWNRFINSRNLSVHDYVGISDRDFLEVMSLFLRESDLLKNHFD